MMTPEQRYLFDLTGYLHLENVLSEEELHNCREASNRYINTPPEELPPDFGTTDRRLYQNGFAFDKVLEALVFHPAYWPTVKELTDNKPRFILGSMLVNHPNENAPQGQPLHCSRENFGRYVTRYDVRNDRIYCTDFAIFVYFWDVYPGDGGLVVLPGSHKVEFDRPETLFDGGQLGDTPPPCSVNITPKAGDVVVMTELTTHGGLRWQSKDRKRCVLVLRYAPHDLDRPDRLTDTLRERLSPETLELMAPGGYQETKEVVHRDIVTLS